MGYTSSGFGSGLGYSEGGSSYIDLRNIPKSAVTVSVSIADEKLKAAVARKLQKLRRNRDMSISAEQWEAVYRCTLKIKTLEEVMAEAGI
ncbi:hypothetical protein ACFY5K_25890 [Streptomyces griseofuscus]|uniref:hypothetical protein n=1 Tax=Streptomyces griseofuscus TaxID=146922 RepID=UPI003681BF1B